MKGLDFKQGLLAEVFRGEWQVQRDLQSIEDVRHEVSLRGQVSTAAWLHLGNP